MGMAQAGETKASFEGRVPPLHRAGRPRWVRALGRWLLRRRRWRLVGDIPDCPRLVLAVGPHTSNWDFVVAMAAMLALDIHIHWLAKHSLFKKPLGAVMSALGGIPVNRSRPEGFARDTAALMRSSETLLLAITPEGTRSKVERLKTGFSRIAREVPCPIMPVVLDFGRREIRLLEVMAAGDSPEEDAAAVRAVFASATAKNPANF